MTEKHTGLPKPRLIDDHYLAAILEELEELNQNVVRVLKELKKGSTDSAPPAPVKTRKAK